MKRKLLYVLLLLAAAGMLLSTGALAAGDAVDAFAEAYGRFETEIEVPVRDFDALMKETFSRYPELYFYYGGCNYLSTPSGLTLTMNYKNTETGRDALYVVDSGEELMAAIGLAMADFKSEVDVVLANGFSVTGEEYDELYNRLEQDYYLIWMGTFGGRHTWYQSEEWQVSWYHIEIDYWNDTPVETVAHWRDATESAVLELASTLFAQDMPDYQKVLVIHDYLVDNARYDMSDLDVMNWENHIPYGPLVNRSSVCQGYAEANRMLLEAAGVECLYVEGSAGGGAHGWNCVQLGGEWYMVDVTWDDPVTDDGSDVKLYDYFNVTSDQLRQDHTWEEGDYPVCSATALNYDAVRQLVDGDRTAYSDYSTERVRTQDIERAELLDLLGQGEPAEPTGPSEPAEPEPVEPTGPAEPAEPEPAEPTGPAEPAEPEPVEPTGPAEPAEPEPAEPTGPAEPAEPDPLRTVVPIDDPKDRASGQVKAPVAVLIVLLLAAGVTVVVIRCVADARVRSARSERKIQRECRAASDARKGRRF